MYTENYEKLHLSWYFKGIKCVNDEIFHHQTGAGQHNMVTGHCVGYTYKSKLH